MLDQQLISSSPAPASPKGVAEMNINGSIPVQTHPLTPSSDMGDKYSVDLKMKPKDLKQLQDSQIEKVNLDRITEANREASLVEDVKQSSSSGLIQTTESKFTSQVSDLLDSPKNGNDD